MRWTSTARIADGYLFRSVNGAGQTGPRGRPWTTEFLKSPATISESLKWFVLSGERGRSRTYNLLIKRQCTGVV
jgi:hypothetical protein